MGMKAPSCPTVLKLCGKDSACTTMVKRPAAPPDSVELIKACCQARHGGWRQLRFRFYGMALGHEALDRPSAAHSLPGNKTVGKFAGEHCIKDLNEACKDRPAPTRFTSNATKQPPDFATSRPPPSTRKP
ncbi:hypothetical protein ZWY2020_046400 [Hordeum vulgare]|nr:hypothetical protein ZWY2020_046400 [Hordeum vulgare]